MILGFKQKFPWGKPTYFPAKIEHGKKIHSIREDKHNRWEKGKLIHMATGVRTKYYNCFMERYCRSVQKIKIWHTFSKYQSKRSFVSIDGELIYKSSEPLFSDTKMILLAKNDGFDSVDDFFKWFDKNFEGVIIHWTYFRY